MKIQIELTILKEDMKEGNYFDNTKCPITKALARAGYPNLQDHGLEIRDKFSGAILADRMSVEYREATAKLIKMLCAGNFETFSMPLILKFSGKEAVAVS